jgi:nicotinamidase-related amidase
MRDFEDYCWRDFVDDEVRYIYSTYVRERALGPRPALVVVHPGAAPCGERWQKDAAKLLADARKRGMPVIHSIPPGSEALQALAPKAGEAIVARPCESAFFSADLERAMRQAGAASLVLCGGPTSAAVRATAVDGKSYGYKVVIAEETVGDLSAHLHAMALFDLAHKYADVMSYQELKEQLA